MGFGDDRGTDLSAKAARNRRAARRARLAMAPEGVNASRWDANRRGIPLSVDRVHREARKALRTVRGPMPKVVVAAYLRALDEELAGTLAMIESIQAQRAERKARAATRAPRALSESQEWPTYFREVDPFPGQRDVDDLEGDARAAYDAFVMDEGVYERCFRGYDDVYADESEAEDDAMPPFLAQQVRGQCKREQWYDKVLNADWGTLPLGVYDDEQADEIREVLAGLAQERAERAASADVEYVPDDEFGF